MVRTEQLREAFSLWIPTRGLEDVEQLLSDFSVARIALDDFLQGHISFKDYLDVADSCGVNIDNYLGIVDDNLSIL